VKGWVMITKARYISLKNQKDKKYKHFLCRYKNGIKKGILMQDENKIKNKSLVL
jgi:hypothetical protein